MLYFVHGITSGPPTYQPTGFAISGQYCTDAVSMQTLWYTKKELLAIQEAFYAFGLYSRN